MDMMGRMVKSNFSTALLIVALSTLSNMSFSCSDLCNDDDSTELELWSIGLFFSDRVAIEVLIGQQHSKGERTRPKVNEA